MGARWVFMVALIIHLVLCSEDDAGFSPLDYEPCWIYRCVGDDGCQRSDHPRGAISNNQTHFPSVSMCRSVCGRFGGIWPKPVTAALSTQLVKIHPMDIRFDLQHAPPETRTILAEMSKIMTSNLEAECLGNVTDRSGMPVRVHIEVTSSNTELSWDTKEHYSLNVQIKDDVLSVHVTAETVYGARHGLETFSHLVVGDRPEYSASYVCSLRILSGAKIVDRPAYKHRGFLLDTSRNFMPISDIKRMITGMAAAKMNVFHWHVTDTHSFPLESVRVPQFTRYGAYSSLEIYTTDDVLNLIEFAKLRGVRIVIEIDAPAHSGNGWQWGKEYGLGDLAVCVNAEPWRLYCIQPPCGQLNPANPHLYRVLKNLYRDIAEMLPAPTLLHMGGDELFLGCWNSSTEIKNYMSTKGMNISKDGFMALWGEFHKKSLEAWDEVLRADTGQGLQPVMLWSSELTQPDTISKYLDKERYVIQVWEPIDSPLLPQLLNMNYRTVSVPKDIWYLDHGFWGRTKYSNWRRMYAHTLPTDPNMLGGEVAMWTELVDNMVLDTRVWPRAAAVAERLWSNPTSTANSAEPRLQQFRSRLSMRGIRPDAISPEWCAHHANRCL